jgi:Pentapeptide repeats (8 copies)
VIVEVKHRLTGAVLWSGEAKNLRDAVQKATSADADLAGADLARADLSDANLARANLAGADLAGADLARADLARANLAGADLADAYLADADLAGADLARADLSDAYLAGANLAESVSSREEFDKRRTESAEGRIRRFRERNPNVPIVDHLDARILSAIGDGSCSLEMGQWHCGTSHCRAGFAVHLAGDSGYALEREMGPFRAGRAIYIASTGRAPHFFASNEAALADIKKCAGVE